ncbi:MAG: DNA polymerase III subunit chi [Pseudomonadota bacterium]
MGEAIFYHLTMRPLEAALPELLEKTLERGWRAVVRCGSVERVGALDKLLWTYRDESFLPHGVAGDGPAERQPIYLTAGPELPNAPQLLFLVDGADASPEEMASFERCCLMFDGNDPAMVAKAREAWKSATGGGLPAVYWAQDDRGRWVKKTEAKPA